MEGRERFEPERENFEPLRALSSLRSCLGSLSGLSDLSGSKKNSMILHVLRGSKKKLPTSLFDLVVLVILVVPKKTP